MPQPLTAVKLRPYERDQLHAVARERGQTLSAVIRAALVADGALPPREPIREATIAP